jgi:Ras family protein A
MSKNTRELVCKVVVCGDGAVGKTCILAVYQKGTFPAKYVPTVFENFTSTISIGEKKISLGLWDTAGQVSLFFLIFRKTMIDYVH